MTSFTTNPAVASSEIREQMLQRLSSYYPKGALDTNAYYLISMFADILTDVYNETEATIEDTGLDEAREGALYRNFGAYFSLKKNTTWEVYRFLLKVLFEAFTLYGSTIYGICKAVQAVTGVSPYILEHYKYGGWVLGVHVLGASAIVLDSDYIWNSITANILSGVHLRGIAVPQASDVWVCGGSTTAKVFRSASYKQWEDYTPEFSATSLNGIHVGSNQSIWVCGENASSLDGVVFKYQNGWGEVYRSGGTGSTYRDIWVYNDNFVFVVGDSGEILHWNGSIWMPHASPVLADLHAVHGYDTEHVYVVGDSNTVLYYNGTSWTDISTPGAYNWESLHVVSEEELWICGEGGYVGYSNNAGSSWDIQQVATSDLYDITVSNNGIRVCGDGTALVSTDGSTWKSETIQGSGISLLSLGVSNSGHLYTCGTSGTVLHNSGGGYLTHIKAFTLPTNLQADLNESGIYVSESIRDWFSSAGYPLTQNATRIVVDATTWYIIDTVIFRILLEAESLNVYTTDDIFYKAGSIIWGAILESRVGRCNSVDFVVWNVQDSELLQRILSYIKPAHVKAFIMHELPFVDTTDEDAFISAVKVNQRSFGVIDRAVYSETESHIPSL